MTIRYRATLVFDATEHMSTSYLKRCLRDALQQEALRVDADDPLHSVQHASVTVERVSAVRLGEAEDKHQ